MNRTFSYFIVLIFICYMQDLFAQCTVTINSFPYQESFETGTANWNSGGTNNDWTWGAPAKPIINSAGAGNNCWITGGLTASFYSLGERSWVQSPCFDFTNLDKPYISFLIFWETERKYDGGNLQYSLDGGVSWANAGAFNHPDACNDQNWYNISSITNLSSLAIPANGWSGTSLPTNGSCNGGGGSGGWVLATHCLKELGHKTQVRFRFTFGSGTTCNDFDGLAFDDIYIGQAPSYPNDFVFDCIDQHTLHFTDTASACFDSWSWNFGDPSSSSNLATGKNVNHEFTSGGNYTVTLTTGGSCFIDTQIVKQVKILSASTQSGDVSCISDSDGTAQVIVSNAGLGITYSWLHDATLTTSLATGLQTGNYNVIVSEPGSCSLSLEINVDYGAGANPKVNLGEDTSICPGSFFRLNPGKYLTYVWQDNSTDSFLVVNTKGEYTVSVSNSSGCTATDTLEVIEDCLNDIILPNSFTPNGDGKNEFFSAYGSETSAYSIFIFNRWGELIFNSENRNLEWDGAYKGNPVEEGIYNYLVNYTIGKEARVKNGSIYIYR